MIDDMYIGYCEYEPRSHTRIICEARCENGAWVKQDLSRQLPPVGKVFAISMALARKDQYIALTAEPNPRDVDIDKDTLIVQRNWSPREVLDMRGTDLENIRYKSLEDGFEDLAMGTDEVVIALNDTECVVVPLRQHVVEKRFVADPGHFKVHKFDSRVLNSSHLGGRLREVPEITVGAEIRGLEWLDDGSILDRLLKRLKRDTGDGPSRNEREKIMSYLNRARIFQESGKGDPDLVDWIVGFIGRLRDHMETIPLIVDTLKDVPEIRADIDASLEGEKATLRQELRATIEAEITSELEDLLSENQKVAKGIEAAKGDLDDAVAAVVDLQQQKDNLHKQLSLEIEAIGQTLEDLSDTEKTDINSLVERLGSALGDYGSQLSIGDPSIPPWIAPRLRQSEVLEPAQLERAMRSDAIRTGIASNAYEYLDLGLRSGTPVVLAQEAAERMIPAYASRVSGGVYFREIVGPGTISLDDLWSRPGTGTHGGLRQAWTAARKITDRYHIFWLDRIDAAPLKLWLTSLLGVLDSPDRPENLLVCMSLAGKPLDPDMGVPEIARQVLGMNPKLSAGSATALFRKKHGEANMATMIPISTIDLLDEEDLRGRIEAMTEASPRELALEVGLHHAACLFQGAELSPSVRVSRLSGLRVAGTKWIEQTMLGEEVSND